MRISGYVFGGFILASLLSSSAAFAEDLPRCLFVDSYHAGYEWSDGVRAGLHSVLDGKCDVKEVMMNTKLNRDPEYAKAQAKMVMGEIEAFKPDVVIASDDNAQKYLVVPYLKNTDMPVVFAGVNWTVDAYGYPAKNITGIIEVGPIEELVDVVKKILAVGYKGAFLRGEALSSSKDYARMHEYAVNNGITLDDYAVTSIAEWESAFKEAAENYDFIVVGNYASINDWDAAKGIEISKKYNDKLIVAYDEWMMPYAMFGWAKIPREHGEWAGQVALKILDGVAPNVVPITTNRRWQKFINSNILAGSPVVLPYQFIAGTVDVSE